MGAVPANLLDVKAKISELVQRSLADKEMIIAKGRPLV